MVPAIIGNLLNRTRKNKNIELRKPQNDYEVKIRRRRAILTFIARRLVALRFILILVGYIWMLVLPAPRLSRRTWVDENALQPGRVELHWNWGEVHQADRYLDDLEALRDANATSAQRAEYLLKQLRTLGLPTKIQTYNFSASTGDAAGTNVYAVLSTPRTPGTEAMVISASWLSRTDDGLGTLNLRGIATVLSLAGFLKRYSHWAKDLIFVLNDGYLDGMQAWLSAYYNLNQGNLRRDPIELTSGVIWTALNIDYPGHSYSHLGIFHEGLNGRLPNQDLVTSLNVVGSQQTPVVLYDYVNSRESTSRQEEFDPFPTWMPKSLRNSPEVYDYAHRGRILLRHLSYQARGRPSGVHGLFHQYRIDAITLYAYPATGPYGFHSIGRTIEGTLRATNNMLERLHASFFFYLLVTPGQFIQIGNYLPSAILVSMGLMTGGLKLWSDLASSFILERRMEQGERAASLRVQHSRPVLLALAIVMGTHLAGALLLFTFTRREFVRNYSTLAMVVFIVLTVLPPMLAIFIPPSRKNPTIAPLSHTLKSINLCFASTIISISSVLNFSLAASVGAVLGIPLSLSSPSPNLFGRTFKYFAFAFLGFGWTLFRASEVKTAIRDWELYGGWFAPFLFIIYVPLVFQAAIVCLQPE